jgi:uncharacterized protein (DUF2147 family)
MNKNGVIGAALLACAGTSLSAPARAADPLGEWLVQDGVARIRIVECNTRIWGVVAWEKEPGGVDAENPDRSKRSRPTLGMPILLNMKKAPPEKAGQPDQWEGKVYNAKNGKTYDAKIKPLSADKLEIKGCVLGFLCGGETWTRYVDPAAPGSGAVSPAPQSAAKSSPPPVKGAKAPAAKGGAATATAAAPADPSADVCLLPEIAGAPH